MKPETREKVLRSSAELGYRPNDLARALRHHRTAVIGLVVPDISNPYYPGLVRGVEDCASAAGNRVVLCNTDRDPDKTAAYLDALVKSRVDGVIIAGGAADTSINARAFQQYRTKAVVVGRHKLAYPSVQIDNVAAAEETTKYLLDLGHERLVFLGGPLSSHTVQDRLTGFRTAVSARGLPVSERLVVPGELDEESGYQGTHEVTRRRPRPTAILAANDRVAVGVLAALSDLDLAVPAQVSVVGFDDISISSYLRPRLTTVAIPTYEIGAAAADLLLSQFDESIPAPADDYRVLLPTKLVVRDSAAAPPRTRSK